MGYNNCFSFFLPSTFCLYVFQSTKFYGRVRTTCDSWSTTLVEAYDKRRTINGKEWPKFPVSVRFSSRVKKFIAKNWFTPQLLNWIPFKVTAGIVAKLYDAFYFSINHKNLNYFPITTFWVFSIAFLQTFYKKYLPISSLTKDVFAIIQVMVEKLNSMSHIFVIAQRHGVLARLSLFKKA